MKNAFYLLFLIACTTTIGQEAETFLRDKEFYIRGNTAVIGNNILSKDNTKAYHKTDKLNDEFKMRYVDIDDSPETWSSSSAYLDIDDSSEIIYAALYWTAIYKGDRTAKRLKDGNTYYKVIDERSKEVRQVKLKGPNETYTEVQGTLIYDGENSKSLSMNSRAPYACMADVTELIKDQKAGSYTVANVAATQGQVMGGSAAGWILYVVYENNAEPLQYITTYHGYEFVNKKAVEISFGNFSTPATGEVETSVTIGALEGDSNLKRDQVGIYNPKDAQYITLDNKVRASNNFFNSSITINDSVVTRRNPNSSNTLGFDLAKIKIPNTQNAIISNSATGVKMQYATRSDRFFVFFTAFQTTISEQSYNENRTGIYALAKNTSPPSTPPQSEVQTSAPRKPIVVNQKVEIAKPKPVVLDTLKSQAYQPKNVLDKNLDNLLNGSSVSIENIGSGYYIINNVFSKIENAEGWMSTLQSQGLQPQMFLRPENNLFYVFLAASTNAAEMNASLKKFKETEALKDSWILKVNLD